MIKDRLIKKLDKITDRAASSALSTGYLIPMTDKSVLVGNMLIEKNRHGLYNILSFDKRIVYEDILVFDVAVTIAQRHTSGEYGSVKQILYLEEKYSKYHTDMVHYLSCLKGAKKNKDYERMAILEDKFQVSESLAKKTRDQISIFKRIK